MKNSSVRDDWSYFQTSNKLLGKFNFEKFHNLKFLKKISRLNSSLKVVEDKIISVAGENEEQINVNTIALIAYNYASLLKQKYEAKKQTVLIGHDENEDSSIFSSFLSSFLIHYGIKVYNFTENHATPFSVSFFTMNQLNLNNLIYVSKNNSIADNFTFSFKNQENKSFTTEEIEILNSRIHYSEIQKQKKEKFNLKKINYIDSEIFDEYVEYILKENKVNKEPNFSFSYISLSMAQEEFLRQSFRRLNYKFTDYQIENKIFKLDRNKALIKQNSVLKFLSKKIKKEKNDIGFIFSTDSTEIACLVKQKSLVKYLDYNSLIILYLNYLKETKSEKVNFYRLDTTTSFIDSYVKEIPKSKVIVSDNRNIVLRKIQKNPGFSIYFDEENKFFVAKHQALSSFDALTFAMKILEMASYYKKWEKTLFDVLSEIQQTNGLYRENTEIQYVNKEEALNLVARIEKLENLNNQKIINRRKTKFENNYVVLQLILLDKTDILIKYNNYKNELKYIVRTPVSTEHFSKKVIKEKAIIEEINSKKEMLSKLEKSNIKKTTIKYSLSLLFLAVIFYLTFRFLYTDSENGLKIFRDAWAIFTQNRLTRTYFILITAGNLIILNILYSVTIAWMLKKQNVKIKIWDLFMSSFIGISVSNITPFYVGGDIVSFWYLRKKGYDTSKLAASYLASGFIFQITLVLYSLIMLPFIFTFYSDFFAQGTQASYTITVSLILGVIINGLGVLLYWILAYWKWLQIKIVSTWIYILEWIPYTFVLDPAKLSGSKYYGFEKTRNNFISILKNFKLFFVVLIIKLISAILTFAPFIGLLMNMLVPNLEGGFYLNIWIGTNIVKSANSISITPGGVGTGDFIVIEIFKLIFYPASHFEEKTGVKLYTQEVSKIYSFLNLFLFYQIPTIFSGLSLLTVWVGQKRIEKYNKIQINQSLALKHNTLLLSKRTKTYFFKIITVVWILGISGLIAALLTI
ncbi:lysylphosphatidylglycerol synthase domain-containing protein [Mycoplasma iguanae]|uniref:Lysylphosphatidylglycerol synthase domain-containing protein n=1 Tax=Mycoplasma iguanae TaxID=292461 RepID=A0ABY5RBQ3_9MOLU|nr:lysylphosphatidylglycerol synthase domain-containing protein [Mycoplasma iguanae]UVD81640.1 lysylphosphatidylglycerol synthase domain-containing protein [Mycoplasma iguanae]